MIKELRPIVCRHNNFTILSANKLGMIDDGRDNKQAYTHSHTYIQADWPAYISTKSDPAMERNDTFASAAMALASLVVYSLYPEDHEGGLPEEKNYISLINRHIK